MKKLFSNPTEVVSEVATQAIYSLKVLMIGLFIPFSFIFGISYNRHIESTENGINISKPNPVIADNTTVDLRKVLSDQNS
jgi:hypothetical protein